MQALISVSARHNLAGLETLVPLRAAQTYTDEGYGFFSAEGFRFWLPWHVGLLRLPFHYLLTPAGFWLTGPALRNAP